ncbi:unnamed protein product, partial [Polarella glacialis]
DQEKKNEILLERRREKDDEQRADCTFAPEVRDTYAEPERPVVVSGLGRYFELKGLALRKQQEQQEREAKVFRPEAGKSRSLGVTIPEPFTLSSSGPQAGASQSYRSSSELPTRSEEYTFTPKTNESVNRDIIRQIMRGSPATDDDLYYEDLGNSRACQAAW